MEYLLRINNDVVQQYSAVTVCSYEQFVVINTQLKNLTKTVDAKDPVQKFHFYRTHTTRKENKFPTRVRLEIFLYV